MRNPLEDFLLAKDDNIEDTIPKGNYTYYKANKYKRPNCKKGLIKYPHTMHTRVTAEVYDKINAIALEMDVNESEAVRIVLDRGLMQ